MINFAKKAPVVSREYGSYSPGYYDGHRRKRMPSQSILAGEYKRIIYTCSNLNANGVACARLRLYLKSEEGDNTVLRKGEHLQPVTKEQRDWLFSQDYLSKAIPHDFVELEEVIKHPALDALHNVNDESDISTFDLFTLTQLYLDVCGKAYWYIPKRRNPFAKQQIWVLPSQFVTPMKVTDSRRVIDYFEYNYGYSRAEPEKIPPDQVVFFKNNSLLDPYMDGVSPAMASFDSSELNNMLLSNETGLLENRGVPDFVVSPGKDGAFSRDSARIYEQQWKARFGRGRGGGIYALDEHVEITPLQVSPRDLAELEIAKASSRDIANTHAVPYVLISGEKLDRDEREAAEQQHAKHAILPRCTRNAATLNKQFLPTFDPTGRLFFAYDDPVPENRAELRQEVVELVSNGIWSVNRGLERLGDPPRPEPEFDIPRALFDGNGRNNRTKTDEVEGE